MRYDMKEKCEIRAVLSAIDKENKDFYNRTHFYGTKELDESCEDCGENDDDCDCDILIAESF